MGFSTNTKNKKVFVAMSGGVDSSVAAALLKRAGFDVTGVFMKNWNDPKWPCLWKEDRLDAMRVCAKLNIPFKTVDFSKEYWNRVVEYMIAGYKSGITPNPDVMCNREIKFGILLGWALKQGADYIATGHYVREYVFEKRSCFPSVKTLRLGGLACSSRPLASRQGAGRHARKRAFTFSKTNSLTTKNYSKKKFPGVFQLLNAKDENKDQSYFLWTLTQEQLKHCLFPIGDFTKKEVREMARKFGLSTAEKKDSQGICFVGEIPVRDFLKDYIKERRGEVLTTDSKKIGYHNGAEFYTIGQRQGLGIGGGMPYYIVDKDVAKNTITVALGSFDDRLFRKSVEVCDINWISGKEPNFPLKCRASIRYRQVPQSCFLEKKSKSGEIRASFNEPQRAITPGQSIVFYRAAEMLGGGIMK